MVFSSAIFLYAFLPTVLALYYVSARRLRNVLLLLASLIFYAWGEPVYVLLMMASIIFNWIVGLAVDRTRDMRVGIWVLSLGVATDILLLAYFKYAAFAVSNLNDLLHPLFGRQVSVPRVALPLGISFFTFHAISYIVDIYRREADALRSPLNMGVYISLFPQLIAGPIIRYHDVAAQILHRSNSLERFSSGIERFVFGMGKKVLIANTLGIIADQAFSTPALQLSASNAWLGIVCYTLQIYFDFSGYSDMAIGLARMFGFELTENFNYPYISRSIREFWRRWHISLSTWFRDYLYIPLGGNRVSSLRVTMNLFIVFLLCGLWHGASWNFAVWGLFHGALLAAERGPFGRWLDRAGQPIGSLYTMTSVVFGWVLFRASDLSHAMSYFKCMLGASPATGATPQMFMLLDNQLYATLLVAIALVTPVATSLSRDWRNRRFPMGTAEPIMAASAGLSFDGNSLAFLFVRFCMVVCTLVLSAAALSATTYNPFIYFRF